MRRFIVAGFCLLGAASLVGCEHFQNKGNSYVGGQSTTPPHYLEVKGFKHCLKSKNMGSWKAWCMPARKPAGCSNASWHELYLESKSGGMQHC